MWNEASMKRSVSPSRVRALTAGAGAAVSTRRSALRDPLSWLASSLAVLLLLSSARASGPENPVIHYGNATFQRQGNTWIITSGNRTIVSYSSFNIPAGDMVQFLQSGAGARFLNRINSAAPTQIDGSIFSNGSVYFVNPAGVIFGNGSVINAANFVAAAGQLSDQDFLAGRDHFTNLSGSVVNNGRIEVGQNGVAALIGRHVANYGTIVAPQGTVVLAAGKDVFLGENGGRIFARVEGGSDQPGVEGVRNDGLINAGRGRAVMAAGDIYGMAVVHRGRTVARDVTIDGGNAGEVRVSGSIDASGQAPGEKGGRVEITGHNVALLGADIDVSGHSGGGAALVGGGREGKGLDRTANALFVDSATRINADATHEGDGGEIVLFSRNATRTAASLSARGGLFAGNGGFIETSGGWLQVSGAPDTRARFASGRDGHWFIDPLDLTISNAPSLGVSGAPVFAPGTGAANLFIGDLVTALTLNSVVTIQTLGTVGSGSGLITFADALDLPATNGIRTLNVLSAGGIAINASIRDLNTATGGGLNLNLVATTDISLGANVDIRLNQGRFTSTGRNFSAGSNSFISAGPTGISINHTGVVSLQRLTTQAPVPGVNTLFVRGSQVTLANSVVTNGGSIDVASTVGLLNVAPGATGLNAGTGDITLVSAGGFTQSAPISGRNVSVRAQADLNSNANILATGGVDLRAGQAGSGLLNFGGSGTGQLTGSVINLFAGNQTSGGSEIRFSRNLNVSGPLNLFAGPGLVNVVSSRTLALTTPGADLSIVADSFTLAGSLTGGSGSALRLRTATSARSIVLGAVNAASMDLDAGELGRLSGFSSIVFNRTGQSGNVVIDGPVSMARSALFQMGAGVVRLNSDLTLTGAGNSFSNSGRTLIGTGPVTLTAANASFSGLVDAAAPGAAFRVSSPGLVLFNSAVGSTGAFTSLTVDGGATTRVRDLVRAANASFAGNVDLLSSTSFSGGSVAINGALNSGPGGPFNALFLGSSVSLLGGAGTSNALLSLLTSGPTTIRGDVNTIGSQFFGGPLTVTGLSTFNAGGAWSVLGPTFLAESAAINAASAFFAGTVNSAAIGGRDLTITSPGMVTFNAALGTAPGGELRSLVVNDVGGTGLTRLASAVRTTAGGNASFGQAVELTSDTTLTGGSFQFLRTLDSGTAGPFSLIASGPGTITFADAVGSGRALRSLNTGAMNLTVVRSNVTTTQDMLFSTLRLEGAPGERTFSTLGGAVTYQGAVAAATPDVGLLVDTSGLVTFNSTVGSGVSGAGALASLTRSGPGDTILRGSTLTAGDQTFDGNVRFDTALSAVAGGLLRVSGVSTLNGHTTLEGANVDLLGAVNALGGPRNLIVTTPGVANFAGPIGQSGPLGTLLVNGGGSARLNTLVDATSATFANAVDLASDTLFRGGTVTFQSTLDALNPAAAGATFQGPGGITFNADVGSSRALSFLVAQTAANVNASITTSGQQRYEQALTISGPSTLNAGTSLTTLANVLIDGTATLQAATVSLGGPIDSRTAPLSGSLFIVSPGAINLAAPIGATRALANLDVSGGGITTIATTIRAANADFRNATLLGADTLLADGAFTFHQTLDSLSGPFALTTSNVSTLSFLGHVGSGSVPGGGQLRLLDTGGALQTILAGDVTARDAINFGSLRLDADSQIRSTSAGPVTFAAITSPTPRNLGVFSNGVVTFNGPAGTLANPLASINRTGSGLTVLANDTFTSGDQAFVGDVRFDGNRLLRAGGALRIDGATTLNGDADIAAASARFGAGVDSSGGPRSLIVSGPGDIEFVGPIGLTGALANLTVTGGGRTTINSLARVLGSADFQNATLLGSDTNLEGGSFRFGSTLDSGAGGPFALASLGTGAIEFVGDVGGASRLSTLDTRLASFTQQHASIATDGAIELSELRLLGAAPKSISSTGGTINFNARVVADSGADLSISTPAQVTFSDQVGSGVAGFGALGSLVRTGGGLTVLNANTTTLGQQSFDGALDLNGALTLTSGGPLQVDGLTRLFGDTTLLVGGFRFGAGVDSAGGARRLDITNSGLGEFAAGAGVGSALANLAIQGAGTTRFAGLVRVLNSGSITLDQASEISGPSTWSAGTIDLNGAMNAAPGAGLSSLVLTADTLRIQAGIGQTSALSSLDATGVTLSRVASDVRTTGTQSYANVLLTGPAGARVFNGSALSFGAVDAQNLSIGLAAQAPGTILFAGPVGRGAVAGGSTLAALATGPGTAIFQGDLRVLGTTNLLGSMITVGARTFDTGLLSVGGGTVLGGNFTLNAANARFVGAIDAAAPGSAAFLGNVVGESRFEGGVGQVNALSSFRSNASTNFLRGSLRTTASGGVWFASDLRLDSSLTGVSTIESGSLFFGRDIFTDSLAAPANLTLVALAPGSVEAAPIRIGGNIGLSSFAPAAGQTLGTLVFSAVSPSRSATVLFSRSFDALGRIVAAGVAPGSQFAINASSVDFRSGHKLTTLGSMTINAAGINLHDVNTLGSLALNAPSITIASRPASDLFDNTGAVLSDIGTDWVVGGTLSVSSAPVLAPGAGNFTYSAIGGTAVNMERFSFRQYPTAISVNQFRDQRAGGLGPAFLLFLDLVSLGPTSTNVADTRTVQPPRLGEVARVRQSVSVDPAEQELLRTLGLQVQNAAPQQIVDALVGYSYFENVPKQANPSVETGDYIVTADRLWMKAVLELSATFRGTMIADVPQEDGTVRRQRRDGELRQIFTDSWDSFTASSTASSPEEELNEFRSFVLSDPTQEPTRRELAGLGEILSKLDDLGLTPLEAAIPAERLLEMVRPSALSAAELRSIIDQLPRSGPDAVSPAPALGTESTRPPLQISRR